MRTNSFWIIILIVVITFIILGLFITFYGKNAGFGKNDCIKKNCNELGIMCGIISSCGEEVDCGRCSSGYECKAGKCIAIRI